MNPPTVHPAAKADAHTIAAIMQAGMSAQVRRLTILGSPLLERYVAAQLASESGDVFFIGKVDERIVGMAAWRRLGALLMLNHLYVLAEFRRHGLGRALLAAGLQRCVEAGVETVAVDVFAESQVARAWYAALGFAPQYRRVWLETTLPVPRSMSDGQCTVAGMEQADRAHAEQGFSQFTLHTFTAEYTIGRLADGIFRSVGFGLLRDRPALAALAALDSRRTLLCLGAPEDLPPDALRSGRIVAESERLATPVAHLTAALVR